MNAYDPEKAIRVWQRVQGKDATDSAAQERESAVPTAQELPALIAEEWRDAAAYLYLSRRFQGKYSTMLRHMAEQEQSHASCLRGIYALANEAQPVIRTAPPPQESPHAALRRCYWRELRSLAEYDARIQDPQYGPVFARLAEQEREHCKNVLELLGQLKEKNK